MPKENGEVSSNSGNEPFVCDICGKTLKHQKSLYSHRRTHTDAKAVCHICGATLKSSRYLHHHLLLHKDIDKPHKCDKCGKAFHSSSALKGYHLFVRYLTTYYVMLSRIIKYQRFFWDTQIYVGFLKLLCYYKMNFYYSLKKTKSIFPFYFCHLFVLFLKFSWNSWSLWEYMRYWKLLGGGVRLVVVLYI